MVQSNCLADDVSCAALRLAPQERQDLAIQVLAGTETVSELARQHEVSRKFLYQQGVTVAREVLQVDRLAGQEPERGEPDQPWQDAANMVG